MIADGLTKEDKKLQTYYLCERCETEFCLIQDEIVCPTCGTTDLKKMVVIYKDYDPTFDEMFPKKELQAGD